MSDIDLDKLKTNMQRLAEIMQKLRSERGCPWDREQTLISLKPYLIEEAYEVLAAIERGDPREHCDELGDLLMQVVFQAEVRREEGAFDLGDVAAAIADKLVRRHPHVFGDVKVANAHEVTNNWERLKKREKGGQSALAGVPRALPGLIRAQRVGEKAGRAGMDFSGAAQALAQVEAEIAELRAAATVAEKRQEIGDALFALVSVARLMDVDAEEALRESLDRFSRRFAWVEAEAKDTLPALDAAAKDALWARAKKATEEA